MRKAQDSEPPPVLTVRQRRLFVAYWAVVGAIAGVVAESVLGYLQAEASGIEPLRVLFRALGGAISVGIAFWWLSRPPIHRPERRA